MGSSSRWPGNFDGEKIGVRRWSGDNDDREEERSEQRQRLYSVDQHIKPHATDGACVIHRVFR